MKDFTASQQKSKRIVNKRKSFSKRITESFQVDHNEVQEMVNKGTREENLPSNRLFKPTGNTPKQGA